MAASTEQLIQTGRAHLGRFAFQKRDNPFVSSRAALDLQPALVVELAGLLDGEIDPDGWLESKAGSGLLKTIKIGLIPREARLVVVEGKLVAGVESVHGFLQGHLFWWLVSILWNISLAKSIDPLLGEEVKGSRFHRSFVADPMSSGFMFRDRGRAYRSWKNYPAQMAEDHEGEILGANSLDIKAFYYSIDATPRAILNGFFHSKGKRAPQTRHVRVLTTLLGALHAQYAAKCDEVQPRRADLGEEGTAPLPVGLPSSEVLANLVMSLALEDIAANDNVLGLAAYADDVIVMTPSEALTGFDEDPSAYFARLGLSSSDDPDILDCPSLKSIATLRLRLEKCEVSYSHHPEGNGAGAEGIEALLEEGLSDHWDPYIEGDTGSEWGGRLRTVLRSPHKRERIPQELKEEILALVDEIRVGLTPEKMKARFARLINDLDHGHLLSLQPFWPELLVGGIATHGIEIVEVLTTEMRGVIDSVKMPESATAAARRALSFGLRASWLLALAQAIAVATDQDERERLLESMPELDLGQLQPAKMSTAVEHGMRMRRRRLIPSALVAAPLAEFTSWDGRLLGVGAFSDFVGWFQGEHPEGGGEQLVEAVTEAVRFIHLHEVCLAIHLWAGPCDGLEDDGEKTVPEPWLELAFKVLGAQPLIQEALVADLREKAEGHLAAGGRRIGEGKQQLVRMGMPSIQVNETQLEKLLVGDLSALGQIAKDSRAAVEAVVEAATSREVRFLVLPEWAVVVQQLPWLFEKALRHQMLVIGGQAPEVVSDKYRNWLWTGIPLTDEGGHRVCLVPPPRQKLFLSPKEEALLAEHKIVSAPATKAISVYQWRGMRVASMICYEFADIGIRNFLRFQADVLTVSSLNLDWHYFDAVQDATTRDNYCLTVCVNTGAYPGTRITRPTSSEKAVVASVHGSDDPAVITKRVDLTPIVAAQLNKCEPKLAGIAEPGDGLELADYKPFPPV